MRNGMRKFLLLFYSKSISGQKGNCNEREASKKPQRKLGLTLKNNKFSSN